MDPAKPVTSLKLRLRTFEHGIFTLDDVALGHQHPSRSAADMAPERLELAALVVASFASEFAG